MIGFEQYRAECWIFADGTTRHVEGRAPGTTERRSRPVTFKAVAALAVIAIGSQVRLPSAVSQESITFGGVASERQHPLIEYSLVPWPADAYWSRQIATIEAWPKSDADSEPLPPPMF
jgi:hypothetical protein